MSDKVSIIIHPDANGYLRFRLRSGTLETVAKIVHVPPDGEVEFEIEPIISTGYQFGAVRVHELRPAGDNLPADAGPRKLSAAAPAARAMEKTDFPPRRP